jgi:L-threonylcarbamoyladenylate synthase
VTVLVPNPEHRFPLACGPDPDTLGLRVPLLDGPLAGLAGVKWPVLQSSANLSGAPDARVVSDVPEPIRRGVDLVLDAGELPGTPSTVVDLRHYEADETFEVLREGAMPRAQVSALL